MSIEIDGLTVAYKNGTIGLENATLHAAAGEFFFVVGASGSGKTTLFKTVAGETLGISTGEIKVNGYVYRSCPRRRLMEAKRTIGMVFQDFRLIQAMTVDENLEFAMRCVGAPRSLIDRRIPEVLDMMGISDKADALPNELSGGEQQRVAIARAIINHPLLVIADEPTGDLDDALAREIMDIFVRINDELKTTTMVISHARSLIEQYHKRIVTIDQAHIIEDQDPRKIIAFKPKIKKKAVNK